MNDAPPPAPGAEPPSGSSGFAEAVRRFEAALKAGRRPSIGDWLGRATGAERAALRNELIAREVAHRRARGEAPTPGEYLARFPDLDRAWLLGLLPPGPREQETLAGPEPSDRPAGAGDTFPLAGPPADLAPGGYELISELGRGGMGVVYMARQQSLRRIVALKMILAGAHARPEDAARFRREAETIARLQNPNIVQIYEVGEHRGGPFLALEFCPGGSLEKKLNGKPQPPAEAAALVETLARAVHAAHQQKVVHRDLKPGNILLAADGSPKITDFGLAKTLEDEASNATRTGAIVGTPSYMAPEQAAGKGRDVGPAADVYALGAVLYETLTGRPPFRAATPLDTVLQVTTDDPVRPRRLQPKTPRDLETICLKCLHKNPARRYATAEALADDLRRFRANEPIQARPVGRLERAHRWCQRHPGPAAAWTLAALVVAAAAVVPAVLAVNEARYAARIDQEHQATLAALKEERRQSAASTLERALGLCEQGETSRGLLWMMRGLKTAREGGAKDLEEAFRWNIGAWSREVPPLLLSVPHPDEVLAVAFSRDGATIATACKDGKVRFWRTADGEPVGVPLEHPARVNAIAFDPKGDLLATGCDDGAARLWRWPSGQPAGPPLIHYRPQRVPNPEWPFRTGVTAVAFSASGRTLATGGADGFAHLWDVASGQPIGSGLRQDESGINAIAFSPDGQTLWVAGDWVIRGWDAATGQPLGQPMQRYLVRSLACSPDGKRLVAGYHQDHVAVVWDATTHATVSPPLQHLAPVDAVAFSPDGATILTGSEDQGARLWEADGGRPLSPPLPHLGAVNAVAFHPGGKLFATADSAGILRVWGVPPGGSLHVMPVAGGADGLAFSHDGRLLLAGSATGANQNALSFWDAATGRPARPPYLFPPWRRESWVSSLAAAPDGKTVYASLQQMGSVFRLSLDGGDAQEWIHTGQNEPWKMALSRDGRLLVTASPFDNTARIWDAVTGRPVGPPLRHDAGVNAVAFSPDGAVVLTGSDDQTTRTWDARTGGALGTPQRHGTGIRAVAFSPNGRLILTGGRDRFAQLWGAADGQPVGASMEQGGSVNSVAFSPDGQFLLVGADDGTARFWHAASNRPVGPPLRHRTAAAVVVAWSPRGDVVATGANDNLAKVWAVPSLAAEDLDTLVLRTQVLTAMQLDENGTIHVLDPEDWRARSRRLHGD